MTASPDRSEVRSLRRYIVLVFLVPLGYLFEVCVIPYVRIAGVCPNMLYVVVGIVTVAYGKLRAFWVGMIYGLLMQIMLPSVSYLNLALYSLNVCSLHAYLSALIDEHKIIARAKGNMMRFHTI